jgi:hypothetical protein
VLLWDAPKHETAGDARDDDITGLAAFIGLIWQQFAPSGEASTLRHLWGVS